MPPKGVRFRRIRTGNHGAWAVDLFHRDFFPHYLDQPLVFPTRQGGPGEPSNWPSGHIDYIMLSALSCSPNQLYYIPTKTGIPEADKAELRKWLDWGRKNIAYLKVRKDLPDWPAAGKVDGSAHILQDHGYVFLFNPNAEAMEGTFSLDESIGLVAGEQFRVGSVYPAGQTRENLARGQKVSWSIPAESAVILEIAVQ